jgi:aryl-alcohol dehydrogenase-like predicted oxidoreductase
MTRRNLGQTDLFVNEIGYGSMSLGIEPGNRPTETEAIALLRTAVDELGVELIDTADSYCASDEETGYTERLIAKALDGERRRRVVIATKGGFVRPGGRWMPNGRPEHLRAACERSLTSLGTDVIDLYQLHRVDPSVPVAESIGALVDLQSEGKIRHIGLSNVSLDVLREAVEITPIASVQNSLAPMLYSPAKAELLRYCEENGIAWIAYAPLGGHRNANRVMDLEAWMREVAPELDASPRVILLAWCLSLSSVVIPIPGTRNIENLRENMSAARLRLTMNQVELLSTPRTWIDMHDEHKERGDLARAIEQLEIGLALHPDDPEILYNLACDCALNSESDRALLNLSRAVANGFDDAAHLAADEDFATMRDDSAFKEIVERIERGSLVRS